MPRKLWLALVFLISLTGWLLWLAPASLLTASLDGVTVGNAPLRLSAPQGSIWQGSAGWRWRELAGNLSWDMDWRGLVPGVQLGLAGGIEARGWLGGRPDDAALRDFSGTLGGAVLSRLLPKLQLEGTVSARGLSLSYSDKRVRDVAGRIAYTGGEASWARQSPVQVPPLTGELESTQEGFEVVVRTPRGQDPLALAAIQGNVGSLKVYRAWAAALGLSRGGAPGDVVFETSLPLWQP